MFVALLGVAVASLLACSTFRDAPQAADGGAAALCAPSRQARCTCDNGLTAGFVNCNTDGTGYEGRCSCEAAGFAQDGGAEGIALDASSPGAAGATAAERCADLSSGSSPKELGATSVSGSDIENYPFLSFSVQAEKDYFVFVDSRKGTGLTAINFKAELYEQ